MTPGSLFVDANRSQIIFREYLMKILIILMGTLGKDFNLPIDATMYSETIGFQFVIPIYVPYEVWAL